MNLTQRQFLQTENLAFVQPTSNQSFSGRTYTVYLRNNQLQPAFVPQSPPQNPLGEILLGFGLGVVLIGGVAIVAEVLNELFGSVRNDEPLTAAMRTYVRERDGEICFYCKGDAPDGHVDHRTSRANGGSNDPRNLTWACIFCNCSKGALNETEFIRLLKAGY